MSIKFPCPVARPLMEYPTGPVVNPANTMSPGVDGTTTETAVPTPLAAAYVRVGVLWLTPFSNNAALTPPDLTAPCVPVISPVKAFGIIHANGKDGVPPPWNRVKFWLLKMNALAPMVIDSQSSRSLFEPLLTTLAMVCVVPLDVLSLVLVKVLPRLVASEKYCGLERGIRALMDAVPPPLVASAHPIIPGV